jgi:anti-sigma factor RsiW
MSEIEQHDAEWNDRLQDLIDGDVAGLERATTEGHVAGCARCRSQFASLKKLDALLHSKITAPSLTHSFDHHVFARINARDTQAQERARRRIDRELQENLETLSKGWRRGLLSLIGGAVAGVALALALITWTDQTGFTNTLVGAASNGIGAGFSGTLHTFLTIAIGAAIGGVVSRWLLSTVE